jgi:hypothetical protein
MFARVHILETTPEAHDDGLDVVRSELLPWLRDSTGYRGLVRLSTADRAKTLVISLWADEESMLRSAEAGRDLWSMTAEAVGSKHLALEDYEVTFIDANLTRDELPS